MEQDKGSVEVLGRAGHRRLRCRSPVTCCSAAARAVPPAAPSRLGTTPGSRATPLLRTHTGPRRDRIPFSAAKSAPPSADG